MTTPLLRVDHPEAAVVAALMAGDRVAEVAEDGEAGVGIALRAAAYLHTRQPASTILFATRTRGQLLYTDREAWWSPSGLHRELIRAADRIGLDEALRPRHAGASYLRVIRAGLFLGHCDPGGIPPSTEVDLLVIQAGDWRCGPTGCALDRIDQVRYTQLLVVGGGRRRLARWMLERAAAQGRLTEQYTDRWGPVPAEVGLAAGTSS